MSPGQAYLCYMSQRAVVVVATSNRKPSDLYQNGINRQLFLPFIRRLEEEMDVIELKSARDYRLDRLTAAPVYYCPLGPKADAAMDAAFARLTAGVAVTPDTLDVQGRRLAVPGVETMLTPTTVWWPDPDAELAAETLAVYRRYLA